MRLQFKFPKPIPATILTLLVALMLCPSIAAGDDIVDRTDIQRGTVMVAESGQVLVCLVDEDGPLVRKCLPATNGHGLLRAGKIYDGQTGVFVRVHSNNGRGRGGHRGHVTVLK